MRKKRHYRFPGMDPWLENPVWWTDVHLGLITDMSRALTSRLSPRYVAKYGIRLVVENLVDRRISPDITVSRRSSRPVRGLLDETIDPAITVTLDGDEREEPFIEVRIGGPLGRVVTIIEVLSPTNKEPGADAHEKYRQKQEEILSSDVNLVEIDLLRGGKHVVSVPQGTLSAYQPYDYLVTVRRADRRSIAEVYPVPLRQRLPRIPVPLLKGDPDVAIDLQAMVEGVFEAGMYQDLLDYDHPPMPPLAPADAAWAREWLTRRGRRL